MVTIIDKIQEQRTANIGIANSGAYAVVGVLQ
jgi:hypothetical protein